MQKPCEKLLGRKTVSVSREASEILAGRALGAVVGALSGPGQRWERGLRLVFHIALWSEDGLSCQGTSSGGV